MLEKGYGASIIGRAHIVSSKPNQDAYFIYNSKKYTLAVVCDGLGSKKYSHIGSSKLTKIIHQQIRSCFKNRRLDIEKLISLLKVKWRRYLKPLSPNHADTTCIFTVITEKNISICQIGDGLCAYKINDELNILSEKSDIFSNQTKTFYRSKFPSWQTKVINREKNQTIKMIICTDGISEDLKMDFLSEFIDDLLEFTTERKIRDNQNIFNVISNWPNKYSNDDKTMVVIK